MPESFQFPDEQENEIVESPASDELEVEIVDDTPERDQGRKPLTEEVPDPSDDELSEYSKGVQEKIKKLTHARHDERRAKEALVREKQELERVAQKLLQENNSLRTRVQSSHETIIKSASESANLELESARAELRKAQEAFDTDAIIAAQEKLTDAKLRIQRIQEIPETPLQPERVEVQTRQEQFKPVPERVQPDEKTLRWQARNQWFGANGFEEVTAFSLALHQKLVNSGVDPRSDEYFGTIDSRVRSKFPEVFGDESSGKNGTSKRPASVVAPVSRASGPKKVVLTKSQVAIAKKFGLTPQQYAAEFLKMENQNGN